jgi:hypothetical protein
MRSPNGVYLGLILGVAALTLLGGPARASRCGSQNPPRCGLDAQTNPPTLPGGTGGCTDANLAQTPMCEPGDTMVIYDLGQTFPDNGIAADHEVAGTSSFVIIRAGDTSACAHMVDTVDPKPCPDPVLCPGVTTQPEGAVKVGITGYIVGCWSPPDHDGCRTLAIATKAACLHVQHQFLGPGCMPGPKGEDCPNVTTEQIGIDVPGAKNRRLCGPTDPTTSCRGTHGNQGPGLRFWIGGVCSTNNCANPGTGPTVDPVNTCDTSWGATKLGYNTPPGHGLNQPGWYDWKTGAFKVDVSSPKPSCGPLGACLGVHAAQPWDLQLVAVPRPGQQVPCVGDACDAPGCFK